MHTLYLLLGTFGGIGAWTGIMVWIADHKR